MITEMAEPLQKLEVDGERLYAELEHLATLSDSTPPAVTRVVFTRADQDARAWMRGLCAEAGLQVGEDAVGNLFARWVGSEPDAPAIGTGSHIDAIPESGRFDGTVGVLGGLEAIRALQRSGFQPRRSLELLLFTSEEPTRFGLGCLGSRLLTSAIALEKLDKLRDKEDGTVRDAAREAGFSGELETVALPKDYYRHFVELHIEQGPHLEREGLKIGVVTAIAAPAALRVIFHGDGGHAGAVLMPDRHDASLGAAELALLVDEVARNNDSPNTVGTTGLFQPFPGAVNSIPSKCTVEIDVRDTDGPTRDRAVERITTGAKEIAERRGLQVEILILNNDPPAACDERIVAAAEAAATAEGLSHRRMVSRAYHDSLFMARVAPIGMIFIPCYKGYSHRPDEFASKEDIAAGVAVLARTMAELSVG